MGKSSRKTWLGLALSLFATGNTLAANINIGDPAAGRQAADVITVSQTWTSNNVYSLQDQIFIAPGATLTIEAGTVVASIPTANGSGSLAITAGAKIFVLGTAENPVIMTSTNDVATWAVQASHPTGKNPKTGTWREAANEWGNLTIMGRGLVSGSSFGAADSAITIFDAQGNARVNTAVPDGLNRRAMEGLVAVDPDGAGPLPAGADQSVLYGGNNDNDDSGSISYLSIRYAGRVVGLGNELNGLSLGGIGRETDISHVEIMNNVDDGIEIWGGTVNLRYVSIWNIGDDSFDIDQGWRGWAQFVLVVQGYSVRASQGSGAGDNGFEMDGAENSFAQPVTTAVIANATFIGQPGSNGGDHATAFRDNARVQFHNCIFMDTGERVIHLDNVDGDGGDGYGAQSTLTWEQTWAAPFTSRSLVNDIEPTPAVGAFNHPDTLYFAQTEGNLIGFYDTVFFNNNNVAAGKEAYFEADRAEINVFNAANNNIRQAASSPIAAITREAATTGSGLGSLIMQRVSSLDPRARNDAITAAGTPPNNGYFTQVNFRGAFSDDVNWLLGWTASDAFGHHAGQTNPASPDITQQVHLTTVSFATVNGLTYTVQCSTDGQVWTDVATVAGDGSTKNVADVVTVVANKIYRVRVQ